VVRVRPDSVAVGEPFALEVSVSVPAGARIDWPALPDTGFPVAMLRPPDIVSRTTREGEDLVQARYTLTAWDVGSVSIPLGDLTIRSGTDVVRIPFGDPTIRVPSVLPGDSTLHVPTAPKPPFPRELAWWAQWWPALVVVALCAVLLLRVRRRRQPVADDLRDPADRDAAAEADAGFARIERMHLESAGEAVQVVALSAAVLQRLLERMANLPGGRSIRDLLESRRRDPRVPVDRLAAWVDAVEVIKFSPRPVPRGEALVLLREAREIARQIVAADTAHREAALRARAEAEARDARLAREAEEEARRASRRAVLLGLPALPEWVPASPVDLTVANPWVLLLLPVLWLGWRWQRRQGPTVPALTLPGLHVLQGLPTRGVAWARVPHRLRWVAIGLWIVALAQPRTGARRERSLSDGIDIALALDISSSMLAEDFQPQNRLEVAKEKVKRFILGRTSDRVALVAFSGEALTQVPLTTNYPLLLRAVDSLQVGQLEDGTAIGTAIATASNRLRSAPGRSRVLVVLTDGENNRGTIDPRTAAQAARAFGIRIYAIGVGSEGMAPVPVGRGLFGLRYENRPVRIDEALLRDVAVTTGGRYFRARDAEALQAIYEQIDRLERTPAASDRYVHYTERYRWPLGFAMLLLLMELIVRARRGIVP
jgi:Ca-activated chloride channel family protein